MTQTYIPCSITKPDSTPQFIPSTTMVRGNYYGEATGIGEQVWRYEAMTGTSVLQLADYQAGSDDIDIIVKARIPHSVEGRLELRVVDSVGTGVVVFLDSGRIVFNTRVTRNTVAQSPITRVATLSAVDQPFFIRAQIDRTSPFPSRAKAWVATDTEPATFTALTASVRSTDTARTVQLRLSAPNTLDSIPAIYDIHYVGIGTGTDDPPRFPVGGRKSVAGTVRAPDGSPVKRPYPVRLCHKATGTVLARGITDTSGRFNLSANIPSSERCYVVSVDTLQEQWTSAITGNV